MSYPTDDPFYLAKRAKTAVGCELARRFTAHWDAGLRLQAYTMQVDDPGTDFDGGSVALWAGRLAAIENPGFEDTLIRRSVNSGRTPFVPGRILPFGNRNLLSNHMREEIFYYSTQWTI